MKKIFIITGFGILSVLSLSFGVVKLGKIQKLDNTVSYAQVQNWQDDSRGDFFDWENLADKINNLPFFRYTFGVVFIFLLIFVFAIWREKKFSTITIRQERVNLITYFNNLLSSIAKKEPWEIFEKIFLPICIGLIASFIAYDLEQLEEKISDKRFHEQIFANYMKEIREIVVEEEKMKNTTLDKFNYLGFVRANTQAVSIRLEDNRKLRGLLLQFLYDTELIKCRSKDDCVSTVDLSNMNLENAKLIGGYLGGANLSGANLSNAKFKDVLLVDSDLSYAKLVGSKLKNVNLNQANLSFAKLNNADLSGADLSMANLTNANLTGAKLNKKTTLLFATFCNTTMPDGKISNKSCPSN